MVDTIEQYRADPCDGGHDARGGRSLRTGRMPGWLLVLALGALAAGCGGGSGSAVTADAGASASTRNAQSVVAMPGDGGDNGSGTSTDATAGSGAASASTPSTSAPGTGSSAPSTSTQGSGSSTPTPGTGSSTPSTPAPDTGSSTPAAPTAPTIPDPGTPSLQGTAGNSRPAYLAALGDPITGGWVVRITDRDAFGTNETVKHGYAKQQPWNADGSLIMLPDWPSWILDGRDYRLLRTWHGPSQGMWSNLDPNLVYGVVHESGKPPAFARGDVRTDWSVLEGRLYEFPEFDEIDVGGGEGNLSADDRYVALFGNRGSSSELIVFDILQNRVHARRAYPGLSAGAGGDIDNATMSPSGNWVIVQFDSAHDGRPPGTELFDKDLNFVRRISDRDGSHGDVGIDADGNEVWVMPSDMANETLHSTRLSDGHRRAELTSSRIGSAGHHISCRNRNQPGWCYISGHAQANGKDSADSKAEPWRSVLAIRLDGTGHVEKVADTRHAAGITNREYERSPMAVPDREGKRMLWASDWLDAGTGAQVHVYVSGF